LGGYFLACLFARGVGQLFTFFLPLKNLSDKKKVMCCRCGGAKSMTKNNPEGLAWGGAKNTGGVLVNTAKINKKIY